MVRIGAGPLSANVCASPASLFAAGTVRRRDTGDLQWVDRINPYIPVCRCE